VIWVLHAEPGSESPFDPASGSVQLLSELSAFDDEPVITKTVHNAFTTTNLHHLLTTRSIRNVVVSGIRTEQCCETTARLASDLGFHVTFVTDATATSPRPHWSLPDTATVEEIAADERTLHCADIMQRTEYALAGRFADISTIDQWTSRLR
jgi:nicotinamidase-related amidase